MSEALALGIGAAAILLFAAGLWVGLGLGRRTGKLESERGLSDRIEQERKEAIKISRSVLEGQMAEQLAPWLPDFPFDPGEVRFLGSPIDFVAFRGSSRGEIEEIAFVEVKSGRASLSRVEKSLRTAIEEGRIAWYEYRVP